MAINVTRWTPDTCAPPRCVVEYTWDDQVPQDKRMHTPAAIIQLCPLHAGLPLADLWKALQDENPRKNKFLEHARATLALTPDQMDQIGWFYDAARVLNVEISFLSLKQKALLQNMANHELGKGKVVIR
jgi:hypothetical protein